MTDPTAGLTRVRAAALEGVIAPEWVSAQNEASRIAEIELIRMLLGTEGVEVYGTTTALGQMDSTRLPPERRAGFQLDLIHNHAAAAGAADISSSLVGRLALAAKVEQAHRGGAGISNQLFDELLGALRDPRFQPELPLSGSTYSCGDVVPGAVLAQAVLSRVSRGRALELLSPSGGLALINGSHVHVGACAEVLHLGGQLHSLLSIVCRTALLLNRVGYEEATNWADVLDASRRVELLDYRSTQPPKEWTAPSVQRPVSVRVIPETCEGYRLAGRGLREALESALDRPSGNPLFLSQADGRGVTAVSQASFLDVRLTLLTAQFTSASLAIGWASERRLQHISDRLVETQQLGELGLIQYAKVAAATLEHVRAACSRRPFAAAGQTAAGVEDFWTAGVHEVWAARVALDGVRQVLMRELVASITLGLVEGQPVDEVLPFDLPDMSTTATLEEAAAAWLSSRPADDYQWSE